MLSTDTEGLKYKPLVNKWGDWSLKKVSYRTWITQTASTRAEVWTQVYLIAEHKASSSMAWNPLLGKKPSSPSVCIKGFAFHHMDSKEGHKLSMRVPTAESQTCHFWLCELHISQFCSLEHTSFILTVKLFDLITSVLFLALKCYDFQKSMILFVQLIGREQESQTWLQGLNDIFWSLYFLSFI